MPTIIPLVILNVIKNFATPPYPPFWRRLEDTLRSKCAESTINPSVSPFSERERFPLSLLSFLHQLNPPSALSLNPSLEDGTKRMTRVGGYRNPGEVTIYPSMSRPQQAEDFSDILLLMYDDKFIRFVQPAEIFIKQIPDLRLKMGCSYHKVGNNSIFEANSFFDHFYACSFSIRYLIGFVLPGFALLVNETDSFFEFSGISGNDPASMGEIPE